jgi:ABC-2 type transport system permease protein
LIRVIALNELRRRLRDRSVLIGCLAAPLLMAAVLGLSFAGNAGAPAVRIGIAGASSQLMATAVRAAQLPPNVHVVALPDDEAAKADVADDRLDGAVAVLSGRLQLHSLLVPVVDPGATDTPGFDVVTRGTSQLGQEYAESMAAALSSALYSDRIPAGGSAGAGHVAITTQSVGHGGKVNLNFFAPNIAVVFLFIGAGLGMRSILMERSAGTLARVVAAPLRPTQIVVGKLAAIFVTGLATVFVIWAVTSLVFGADWGDPLGVVLLAVAATVATCGIAVFLTSLAKTEQQAFGITMLVGLFLALLGGNLLPSGSLPDFFQVVSLATPNGWALVGFGRLDQLHDPAASVIGPVLVLLVIALVAGGLALMRVRRMVEP